MGVRDQIREMREKHEEQIAALRKEVEAEKIRYGLLKVCLGFQHAETIHADEVICDLEEMIDEMEGSIPWGQLRHAMNRIAALRAVGGAMREFDFDEIHEVKLAWWTLTEAWDALMKGGE